ncbi:hypothetical protein L1887_11035 [Cichorium endivia]|nr:hypothetical protein L1887_11035 [Cichorium endivia]
MVCIPPHSSSSSAIVCIDHVCMLFPGRSVHLKRDRHPDSPFLPPVNLPLQHRDQQHNNLHLIRKRCFLQGCNRRPRSIRQTKSVTHPLLDFPSNTTSFMKLLVLSAVANRFSKLKEQAEEYASLIMEEILLISRIPYD